MSLYLKYRPQSFSSIVGQRHVVNTLKNAIKKDLLTHAYLFCGPRGTGKTSTARIIAKSINCTNKKEGIEPCNECEKCKAILNNQLVDLIEIDAASNRGIDEIRELREKIQFAPTQGRAKIYIIDEVHMLTKEAFNALLKTLEEPPSHAYFILATTEAHKIPETIISRCQQFAFKRITEEDITNRLVEICKSENITQEKEALNLIARLSKGGLRDAIGLLEQMSLEGAVSYQSITSNLGITGHVELEAFFEAIQKNNINEGLKILNQVNEKGQSLSQYCSEFISLLRNKMLEGVKNNEVVQDLISYIHIFNEAKPQIEKSIIPLLPLEIAVIKCCNYGEGSLEKKPETRAKQVEIKEEEKPKPEIKKEMELKSEPKIEKEIATHNEKDLPVRIDVQLNDIKKKWKEVGEAIQTPFVKMSFVSSEIEKFEENKIYLSFKSNTLMEKVSDPKNRNEVVEAFYSVLKIKPELKLKLKKMEIKKVSENSTAEIAEEVFGG